ncbi:membrane protein [Streptococcus varani]|uniref:Membrane protein n=1 Tax=Streptococcus varani TaxID=1608583 RepID=A0A0E4CRV6_9STRE|nr:hypothetical protein [Streptococcus varani]CQR23815.1 membrane protein [Streptococcus varani]
MTDQEKARIEEIRKDNAIKAMFYNRYLAIRYISAAYLFINLYWAAVLYMTQDYLAMVLPLAMISFAGVTMWEQFKMFNRNQEEAKITKRFYQTIIVVNIFLALLTVAGQTGFLFPFLLQNSQTTIVLLSVQAVGVVIALWILLKLSRINKNVDKQYIRLKHYLATLK